MRPTSASTPASTSATSGASPPGPIKSCIALPNAVGDVVVPHRLAVLAEIIKQLNLLRPIYSKTTNYGHFGKVEDLDSITWERTDKAAALKRVLH